MATQTEPVAARAPAQEGRLSKQGLTPAGAVHWNLMAPSLIEAAIRRGEGQLADMGPFVANTAPHTGRSPNDKFVVREPGTEGDVDWGKVNQPISPEHFEKLLADVRAYLNGQGELFVQDLFCGADESHRLSVRYVTPNAWHAAFVRNMFIRPAADALAGFDANFTVLHAPEFHATPEAHGTRTGTFIVLHLARRMILIGGTRYAGELKKSMFTVMNYLMPKDGVLSMHCSANIGPQGDTALFFGLSGTGKTTLSADPERSLIGDDEHGWCEERRVQLRGRLLRQGDQPVAGAGAGHLRDDADVRHDPRERGARPGHAPGEVRRPVDHREHARVVPVAVHQEPRAEPGAADIRRTSCS